MNMLSTQRETIGSAVGRIPSGCAILTVQHAGRATGVLVSWIQQAAFEPLMLSVALKHGRPAQELIDAAGRFALNLIGEDPTSMFRHFGRGFGLDEDAFTGLQIEASDFGPLLQTAIAHLGCEVKSRVPAGDHQLYVVEVRAGWARPGAKPYVHTRNSGLSY